MIDDRALIEAVAILKHLEEQLEGAIPRLAEINLSTAVVRGALDKVSRARKGFEWLLEPDEAPLPSSKAVA